VIFKASSIPFGYNKISYFHLVFISLIIRHNIMIFYEGLLKLFFFSINSKIKLFSNLTFYASAGCVCFIVLSQYSIATWKFYKLFHSRWQHDIHFRGTYLCSSYMTPIDGADEAAANVVSGEIEVSGDIT
jgi:hypothetical protein